MMKDSARKRRRLTVSKKQLDTLRAIRARSTIDKPKKSHQAIKKLDTPWYL